MAYKSRITHTREGENEHRKGTVLKGPGRTIIYMVCCYLNILGVGDSGSTAAQACSSLHLFLITKSFRDILTFGTLDGGGVEAASGGDCARGGSEWL
jgi:hypothetical protein